MTNSIPDSLVSRVVYVSRYVGDATDDWFRVKKEILTVAHPKDRGLFSRRHKTSKKHFVNLLENELMDLWETLTGIRLQVDQGKLHTPEDERPARHSALMAFNKRRQELVRAKNENL